MDCHRRSSVLQCPVEISFAGSLLCQNDVRFPESGFLLQCGSGQSGCFGKVTLAVLESRGLQKKYGLWFCA